MMLSTSAPSVVHVSPSSFFGLLLVNLTTAFVLHAWFWGKGAKARLSWGTQPPPPATLPGEWRACSSDGEEDEDAEDEDVEDDAATRGTIGTGPVRLISVTRHMQRMLLQIQTALENPAVEESMADFVQSLSLQVASGDKGIANPQQMGERLERLYAQAAATFVHIWGEGVTVEKRVHFTAAFVTCLLTMARERAPDVCPFISGSTNLVLDATSSYFVPGEARESGREEKSAEH